MHKDVIEYFSNADGYGGTEGRIFIHKAEFRAYDNGNFRYHHPDEFKPRPKEGDEILVEAVDHSGRATHWAFDQRVEKIRDVLEIGIVETGIVLTFRHGSDFGFLEDPQGGEDLLIHRGEYRLYDNGTISSRRWDMVRPPRRGSDVLFVRNELGRVIKWAPIP